MARKKSKRGGAGGRGGGGGGGGLRRPPPAPPREPLSSELNNEQQAGGTASAAGGGRSSKKSKLQQQHRQQQRRRQQREDPPDDPPPAANANESPMMTSLQAAARRRGSNGSSSLMNHQQYTPKKSSSRQQPTPPPSSTHHDALPSYYDNSNNHQYPGASQRRRSSNGSSISSSGSGSRRQQRPSPPPSSMHHSLSNPQHTYDRRNTAKTNNLSHSGGGGNIYGHSNNYSHRGNHYDDGPLLDAEEEQYEQFQEQLYQQTHNMNMAQQQYQQQQHDQQQQYQQQQQQQQSQLQFSSTHRQFNLMPIYNDVEMTSIKSKQRGKQRSNNNAKKGRSTGQSNPLEYNGKVLAYLDSSSEVEGSQSDDENTNGCGDEAGGLAQHEMFYTKLFYNTNNDSDDENRRVGELPKKHEEYYNHQNLSDGNESEYSEEDFDSDDEDEERPLRKQSKSKKKKYKQHQQKTNAAQAVLSKSEQCLNRTLVLAFCTICFIFIRDRTPWWKAHKRQMALQKRHHNSLLKGGTIGITLDDDDDGVGSNGAIDPMAIYNSNDDDSTHTRDHDPLHQYDKYTKRESEVEQLKQKKNKNHNGNPSHNAKDGHPSNEKILDSYDKFVGKAALQEGREEEVAQFIKEHTKTNKNEDDVSDVAGVVHLSSQYEEKQDGEDKEVQQVKDATAKTASSSGFSNTSSSSTGFRSKIIEEDPRNKDKATLIKSASTSSAAMAKYDEVTAGERISNRPGKKSLHHGFMDETYSNRPAAENSESTAAVMASHNTNGGGDGGVVPAPHSLESSQSQSFDNVDHEFMQAMGGGKNAANSNNNDAVAGSSIMNGGAPSLLPVEETNQQQQQESDQSTQNQQELAVAHQDMILENNSGEDIQRIDTQQHQVEGSITEDETLPESDDTLLEWGDPEHEVGVSSTMHQWSSGNIVSKEANKPSSSSTAITSSASTTSPPMIDGPNMQNHLGKLKWDGNVLKDVEGNSPQTGSSNNESNKEASASSSAKMMTSPNEWLASKASQEGTKQQTQSSSSEQIIAPTPLGQPILNQAPLSSKDIKAVYEDSYYRWNHPLRPIVAGDKGKDVPVFWRIPRSASGTVESVLSFCYRMVLANSMGTAQGHGDDTALDVITVGTGARYVNVDMSNPPGIQRAKSLNLGSSGVPDVVATPFLFEAADIFDGIPEQGKCFTMLRHPVDRAVSLYHHYQIDQSGNPNTAQYKGMAIDEFAENIAENNWMVRFLANKRSGSLTWQDLEAAKEVFGRKCLVGLVDKMEESLGRYERFFKWDTKIDNAHMAAKNKCVVQYLDNGDKRKEHPTYEGTAAWEALRKKNEYDVLLYQFAEQLYTQQSKIYDMAT